MIELKIPDFSIEQIANSGQCFRINKVVDEKNTYQVIADDKELKLQQVDKTTCLFYCSLNEFQNFWMDYFDLKTDYGKFKKLILSTNDPYLIKAVEYGYGLRILKQNTWEVIVSFIISQRSNISRIKNIIEKLCQPYERKFFPSPHRLKNYSEEDYRNLGLGYRAAYLVHIVKDVISEKLDIEKLSNLKYEEAREYLKQFHGIGDKVANCILLFGLYKIEAFPIDVWINRIIKERYYGKFDIERFSGYAGIVQQYMFFYERSIRKASF